jgi:hypothetical protein
MGAAESNPVRNMDKRTARRTHRTDFMGAIERFQANPSISKRHAMLVTKANDSGGRSMLGASMHGYGEGGEVNTVQVCVRKRPIFKEEIQQLEFDVVTWYDQDYVQDLHHHEYCLF